MLADAITTIILVYQDNNNLGRGALQHQDEIDYNSIAVGTQQISFGPDNRPQNNFRGHSHIVRVGEARVEAGRYEQE